MKLYTEEQVRDMLNTNVEFDHYTPDIDSILSDYDPIELPSDEEIWQEADKEECNSKHYAFTRGAKWMRDKIQGGNK